MHTPALYAYRRLHRIIAFVVKGRHIKLAFGRAVYKMNVLHVTVKPRVVYRVVYVDWKLRKTDKKHDGKSTLLYELHLKAANVEQTHTHTHTK